MAEHFLGQRPLDVHYGKGALAALASELDRHGVRKPLIVTGPAIASNRQMIDTLREALGHPVADIFSKTTAHTPRSIVLAGCAAVRAHGADGLISFGGSSTSDTMKAIAWGLAEDLHEPEGFAPFAATHDGETLRFPEMTRDPLPTFAVPTTLSAGEFSPFVAMKDEAAGTKDFYRDERLAPKAVILDPMLTLATPERLWLASGIKAIDHCIESLLSPAAQPFTDALVARALPSLFRNLRLSHENPADLDARQHCQIAAWMSFCSGPNIEMGLSHGIGTILGGRFDVPHGETSCVMLPHVMAYNLGETKFRQAWIAELLGVATVGDADASAAAAPEAVADLIASLGLPQRLRDLGLARTAIPVIASDILGSYLPRINPRPLRSASQIATWLESAW
jgi:Alcohol dehydrogenase, class IV